MTKTPPGRSSRTWIQVLRGIPKLRDGSKLRAWLFGIARSTVMDRLREQYLSPVDNDVDVTEVPSDTWTSHEEHELQQMERALGRLPAVERDVLTLFYLQELSLTDIAETLGVPVGTIKSRLFRARRMLREANARWRLTTMTHHTPPAALASELRRLTVLELSRSARMGYVCLLLGASTMTAIVSALLLTEPALPRHTAIAFAVMAAIGLSWVGFAGSGTDPEANPSGQGPARRQPHGGGLQRCLCHRFCPWRWAPLTGAASAFAAMTIGLLMAGVAAWSGDPGQAAVRPADQEAAGARAAGRREADCRIVCARGTRY